nr:T9SS type A sorting domain-containing protein [Bacteroidota bacterium]
MYVYIGLGEVAYKCKWIERKCNSEYIRWAGSLMFEVQSLKSNAGYFTLDVDCGGWSAGLYVLHLQTEKEVLSKKFVKE